MANLYERQFYLDERIKKYIKCFYFCTVDTQYLIRFILFHAPETDLKTLQGMRLEDLVIKKVELEIAAHSKNNREKKNTLITN